MNAISKKLVLIVLFLNICCLQFLLPLVRVQVCVA